VKKKLIIGLSALAVLVAGLFLWHAAITPSAKEVAAKRAAAAQIVRHQLAVAKHHRMVVAAKKVLRLKAEARTKKIFDALAAKKAKVEAAAAAKQAKIDAAAIVARTNARAAAYARANAWHQGYVSQDGNVYWKWTTGASCQTYVTDGCWHVTVITRDGCPSYVAVNANEYQSGTIINQLLDNQGYGIPPQTARLFELDADAGSNVTAGDVTIDCN
jgi:hypothetical protein